MKQIGFVKVVIVDGTIQVLNLGSRSLSPEV